MKRLGTLCMMAVLAYAAMRPAMAETMMPDDDSSYAAGTQAMNSHDWPGAVTAFDQVINAKGKRADAALYWKAYSLNKLNKLQLAAATCDQLHSQYRDSPWNKDCSTLQPLVSINTEQLSKITSDATANAMRMHGPMMDMDDRPQRGSQDDLKILAMNSLLNQDPAKAVPLLKGMLTGNQPMGVKRHALFMLAQSKSPEAESVLHDAVLGKMDPMLQREAIQTMAVFEGKKANPTLVELYKQTSDMKIKSSVISALFITHDASSMVELARNEKDMELKRRLVSQLAMMNDKVATDYMMELLK